MKNLSSCILLGLALLVHSATALAQVTEPPPTLKAHPVPFTGQLHIRGLTEPKRVSLYTLTGVEVLSTFTDGSLSTEQLPDGIYVVRVAGYAPLRVFKSGLVSGMVQTPADLLDQGQGPVTKNNSALTSATRVGNTISIDPFPSRRDKIIFDSQAGLGLNESHIKFSGTGPASARIQYQLLNADEDDTPMGGWNYFTTVNASGQWADTLREQRRAPWLRAVFRVQGQTNTADTTDQRFAIGHCIARFSQSDEYHIYFLGDRNDAVDPPEVINEECLQVVYMPRRFKRQYNKNTGFRTPPVLPQENTARWIQITNANPVSAGLAAMANTYSEIFSGVKVSIALHSVVGTGLYNMLASEEENNRNNYKKPPGKVRWFSDEKHIHDLFTADGQVPSCQVHFFSSSTKVEDKTVERMAPVIFGVNPDGSKFTAPGQANGEPRYSVAHTLAELYNPKKTKFCFITWNVAMLKNLRQLGDRNSVYRDFLTENFASELDLRGAFKKGEYGYDRRRKDSLYIDLSHASIDDVDGAPRLGELLALDNAYQLGLLPERRYGYTHFTGVNWHHKGDPGLIRVYSQHGDITTANLGRGRARKRDQRSLPARGPDEKLHADVRGFFINGEQAYYTTIVDREGNPAQKGDIYIRKKDGAPFTSDDTLTFNLDRWPDNRNPEDFDNRTTYGNFPQLYEPAVTAQARPFKRLGPSRAIFDNPLGEDDDSDRGNNPDPDPGGSGTANNLAAPELVSFDPAYWSVGDGFTLGGDGTVEIDVSKTGYLYSKLSGADGLSTTPIPVEVGKQYRVRMTVSNPSTNAQPLGTLVQGRNHRGFASNTLSGWTYRDMAPGTQEIVIETAEVPAGNNQLRLGIRSGRSPGGTLMISALSVDEVVNP